MGIRQTVTQVQSGAASMQNGKQTRAVILPDNSAIVLYRTADDDVYCSDANSTAYKFPMIDANIIESKLTSVQTLCIQYNIQRLEWSQLCVDTEAFVVKCPVHYDTGNSSCAAWQLHELVGSAAIYQGRHETQLVCIAAGEDGPAAEVPLDGTVYDLETGKVLVWCPKNNPLRFVLGSLKVRLAPCLLVCLKLWYHMSGAGHQH